MQRMSKESLLHEVASKFPTFFAHCCFAMLVIFSHTESHITSSMVDMMIEKNFRQSLKIFYEISRISSMLRREKKPLDQESAVGRVMRESGGTVG